MKKYIKSLLRKSEIESGFYNKPSVQVHKDKSKYKRKNKHVLKSKADLYL
jgi:hypothetical protein